MKKRLLITSIVMMLVCAVALSTATYAWFTSNTSVTASSITMYAATSTEASIGISWTDSSYGTSIAAVNPASNFKFEPTSIGLSEGENKKLVAANKAIDELVWTNGTTKTSGGVATFNSPITSGISNLCYTWNDGTDVGANHTSFFIHNGSTTNEISSVSATVTVTGDAQEFIRVGFFKYDYTANVFKLKGIIADGNMYTAAPNMNGETPNISVPGTKYYNVSGEEILTGDGTTQIPANAFTREAISGVINAAYGVAVAETAVATCIADTAITTTVDLGGLDADDNQAGGDDIMQLKVLVWMDGTALNDDTAGNSSKTATVVLHFDATKGTYVADTFGGTAQEPEQTNP